MQNTALYSISLLLLFLQASIQTHNTLGWKLQGMEQAITEVEVFMNEAIEEFMAAFILLQNFIRMKITNSSVLIQCLASQKKRLLPYRVQLRYLLREIYSRIFKYNNFLGTHNIISWAINDIKTQIGKRE
ncbi:hypothetical protein KSF78_0008788 [Schistosoma japonicum]|nr:hypothetical protein KSF78_0008788 [Schistosoma japonicum]